MPEITSQRRVNYTPEQMFDLVADIESYPHFVPLCEKLVIRSRRKREDGGELVTAAMTIGYKLFRETFTSRVALDRSQLTIIVTYIDGPLQSLENRWSFSADGPEGCLVDFKLSYELRSRTLAMVMGSVFDKVFGRFAEAFEKRAHTVYGSPTFAG
ncbi:MAG: type II toxin-antitoxin system RatA family toxin [Hyphomicrobiales bacterium]|nr:type II toxin-antitoxin system RatA family toxin [Hyphomicrobiales bacterium]OQW82812.1 MAG: ubiquinone-binding protein [Proteobacteria bacterium ST_bin15]